MVLPVEVKVTFQLVLRSASWEDGAEMEADFVVDLESENTKTRDW